MLVGVTGFEPAIACSQNRSVDQTTLHPEKEMWCEAGKKSNKPPPHHQKKNGMARKRSIVQAKTTDRLAVDRVSRVALDLFSQDHWSL